LTCAIPYRDRVRRPETSEAWAVLVAAAAVMVTAVVLVLLALSGSRWWPLASGLFGIACLVMAVAQYRVLTRKTSSGR
jgi:TctA family transporter